MATFTNETKNTASPSNQSKNQLLAPNGIWSSSVLPWQLSLPWQYVGGNTIITWANQSKS